MNGLWLSKGSHETREAGMCAMEAVAWLAGEAHSDEPSCVSPVLKAFSISFNDNLDDEQRQRLRPYLVRMIGTAEDGQDERRSYMALDWLIRTYAPAFLAAAGLEDEAAKLKGLHEIRSLDDCNRAGPTCSAAWSAAWSAARSAAWSAAWSAAESAARSAAWSAAWSAAESAAWSAARSAAWSAAWSAAESAARSAAESAAESAARSAARSAAESALEPTVVMCRESAFEMLDRMIDPGSIHDISELPKTEEIERELAFLAATHD